ncbi:MAG: NAD(P)-binding domain-containing protein [Gammaproteobacteria bacterium]|nr:NAD(P)-binding domain-containing protein [Gammaproteobacteria bacterium]
MSENLALLIYLAPMALMVLVYVRRHRGRHDQSVRAREESITSGLTEPASLHPVIDPNKCIGCRACISACPEMPGHQVLGLIHGKAELIGPTHCIGHGACLSNCPADAITLVFGTERRGVDIPHVAPNFETNVPGIFIAGELGGMGLIRNAIEQGSQAVRSIRKEIGNSRPDLLDVVIVGAGPAGFAASLAAMEQGMSYATIEQASLGGTVAHYPRGKLVMTAPARLPLVGKFHFRETTKEKLLDFWAGIEKDTGVQINYDETVKSINKEADHFVVQTSCAQYSARTVLLAIGRRGSPRKLEVPGEHLPKVTYRLIEPEQYGDKHVLVVGGGDSALEAACSIAEVPGSSVTLSYRSEAFTRAKAKNRERVLAAEANGNMNVLLRSRVARIETDHVRISQDEREIEIQNDTVIVNAGGILPTGFLRSLGVQVDTKFGTV